MSAPPLPAAAVARELVRLVAAVAPGHPDTRVGRWDRDPDLQDRYAEAARRVLAAAAADHALILPTPDETRTEYGVWWHAGDPARPGYTDAIRTSEYHFASRAAAVERARKRIGQYGITGFTIVRREHQTWNDPDNPLVALSSNWTPDPDPGP